LKNHEKIKKYQKNYKSTRRKNDILFKLSDVLTDDNFREIPKCFYNKWGTKERINKYKERGHEFNKYTYCCNFDF
jgi:hypothetical protein